MKIWMTLPLLGMLLLTAGCPYHAPLTEEHTIPTDQELFGTWIEFRDPARHQNKQATLMVMPLSKTEYVLCYQEDGDSSESSLYLRGYPINIGGISCVQLQMIGPVNYNPTQPYSAENKSNHFGVATYEIKGGTLEVKLLNENVVSTKLTTSEALQEAFLANIDNKKLFNDLVRFRDTGVHEEQRLLQKPIVNLVDTPLLSRPKASANPSFPEFATITTNGGIRVYNYAGQVTHTAKHPGSFIMAISYSPDGTQLLVGTKSGDLLIWNRDSNGWKTVAEQVANPISLVGWLGDSAFWGTKVRYTGWEEKPINRDKPAAGTIDLKTGRAGRTFMVDLLSIFNSCSLATSPDGTRFAVHGIPDKPKGIYILDAATGKVQSSLIRKSHSGSSFSVCIAPDNKTVAVGYGKDIVLWNADDESEIRTLSAKGAGTSLAFSPDGRLLLSGLGNGTARIWRVETGEEITRLRFSGSSMVIHSAGFSPDGKKFYALGKKGILKIGETPVRARHEVALKKNREPSPLSAKFWQEASIEDVDSAVADGLDVKTRGTGGRTVLMLAAESCPNPDVVKRLVELGADVNAKDSSGRTALIYAAKRNPNPDTIERLVELGADMDLRDKWDQTVLMNACRKWTNPAVIDRLVKLDADVNEPKNSDGATLLQVAIWHDTNLETFKHLTELGADINAKNNGGKTVLMVATSHATNPDIVELLLKLGADVTATDKEGNTVLDLAKKSTSKNGTEIYRMLTDTKYQKRPDTEEKPQSPAEASSQRSRSSTNILPVVPTLEQVSSVPSDRLSQGYRAVKRTASRLEIAIKFPNAAFHLNIDGKRVRITQENAPGFLEVFRDILQVYEQAIRQHGIPHIEGWYTVQVNETLEGEGFDMMNLFADAELSRHEYLLAREIQIKQEDINIRMVREVDIGGEKKDMTFPGLAIGDSIVFGVPLINILIHGTLHNDTIELGMDLNQVKRSLSLDHAIQPLVDPEKAKDSELYREEFSEWMVRLKRKPSNRPADPSPSDQLLILTPDKKLRKVVRADISPTPEVQTQKMRPQKGEYSDE